MSSDAVSLEKPTHFARSTDKKADLVLLVEANEILWRKSHPEHHKTNVKDLIWQSIAELLLWEDGCEFSDI